MNPNTNQASGTSVARDAAPVTKPALSPAERKRRQRQRDAAAPEPARAAGPKGNPIKWDFGLGFSSKVGEPVSAQEAERELKHAHIAVAKVMRSRVDLDELDTEFKVAGESFATTANHLFPQLRLLVRFIAPLVLAGALVVIWGAILIQTPWLERVGSWWAERQARRDAERYQDEAQAAAVQERAGAWVPPTVVQPAGEDPQPAPRIDMRRLRVR